MPTIHLWRGPNGRIHQTTGESAHIAAEQLGKVISWDSDDLVVVLYRGKPTTFQLQPRGAH